MKFFLGLILSYIFIIERKKIEVFLRRMRDGNFAFFYDEYAVIAGKIGNGFGIIFRAQSIIAVVNSILTTLGLIIISVMTGNGTFPYIVTLALIVFIFGFIPVFGTIISGIPIIIIAYGYGGVSAVIGVLIMLGVVHAVEAYYLNPKIVSSYVHFPVFITFIILTISEHYFGLIGLLVGIPLFSILIGLIEDLDRYVNSIKKEYSLRKTL
jgi:predicted PurR-regulated permease PerM